MFLNFKVMYSFDCKQFVGKQSAQKYIAAYIYLGC